MDYNAELNRIKNNYEDIKRVYFNLKGKEEQLTQQKTDLERHISRIADNIDMLEKIRSLLRRVSEFAREDSKRRIESLVTNCLQFIFDSNLEFKIEINEVRGRPEAEFYVLSSSSGGVIKTKPQDSRGGGVVDVISLAIRIAMLENSNMDIKGPIILDEPAKHVSDEYIIQVAEFLKQVSVMFQRQVIIITHNRHLSEIADKWFQVDFQDGMSYVTIDNRHSF